MENCLVGDHSCNIVNVYFHKNIIRMTNNVKFTFNVGDTSREGHM